MRNAAARTDVGTEGFTLIEALAATVLMGTILTALATITAQWLPNWNRGFSRVQRSELLQVALERVAADLAAVEFITPNRTTTRPLFEGTELAVTFVRTSFGPNTRSGLEIVRIAETADRQGRALVRARAPFAPSTASADQVHFADPVVLMRAPQKLSFSYAGPDRIWKNTWIGARELPAAVRLTVRDAATERVLPISTAVLIHTQLPARCAATKDERACAASPSQRAEPEAAAETSAGSSRNR
jgi:general secretion pathway protein J